MTHAAATLPWGTPLQLGAKKLLLLGSGELGREVALEAMRLGIEVIAVDAYAPTCRKIDAWRGPCHRYEHR